MARNTLAKCATTGIAYANYRAGRGFGDSYYQSTSIYGPKVWKVPHSELMMHVGAAGGHLIALSCSKSKNGKYLSGCLALYITPKGKCGYTSGLPSEVANQRVIRDYEIFVGMRD